MKYRLLISKIVEMKKNEYFDPIHPDFPIDIVTIAELELYEDEVVELLARIVNERFIQDKAQEKKKK